MARIRFVLFMLFLFSLGVKGQQAEKYLSHPLPAGWQEQDAMFQQALPVDDHWWKVFEDVTLDSLIRVAVKQNPSALMAMNRMDMAKANLRIMRAGYYPSLSLDAGWSRQQTSGNTGTGQSQSRVGYFDAGVKMSWQADVFGAIRQRVKAQKESFAASREEYNATMVSLCAEVASAYFNLREAQQELGVLQRNALSQKLWWKLQKCVIIPVWCRNWMSHRPNLFTIVHWLPFLLSNPVLSNIQCIGRVVGTLSTGCGVIFGKQSPVAGLYRTGGSGSTGTTLVAASRCACGRKASECTGCTAWGIQVGLVTFFLSERFFGLCFA